MNYSQVLDLSNSVETFFQQAAENKIKVDGQLSYALNKNVRILESAVKTFMTKRINIVKAHCNKNADGSIVFIKDTDNVSVVDFVSQEDKQKAEDKIKKLLESTVKIDFYKFANIEKSVEFCSGDAVILEILWNLIDQIQSSTKA